MSKTEQAVENHHKRFNCSQSVLMTYCEDFGLDKSTAVRIAEGFGSGMGCRECACGALSAAIMLCGLKNSDGNTEAETATKEDTQNKAKALVEEFRKRTGHVICCAIRDDKNVTCDDAIRIGAQMVEDYLL